MCPHIRAFRLSVHALPIYENDELDYPGLTDHLMDQNVELREKVVDVYINLNYEDIAMEEPSPDLKFLMTEALKTSI